MTCNNTGGYIVAIDDAVENQAVAGKWINDSIKHASSAL